MFTLYLFFAMLVFAILWLFTAVQRNHAREDLRAAQRDNAHLRRLLEQHVKNLIGATK